MVEMVAFRSCDECEGKGTVPVQDYRTSAKKEEPQPSKTRWLNMTRTSEWIKSLPWILISAVMVGGLIIGAAIYGIHHSIVARTKELSHQAYIVAYTDLRSQQRCFMADAIDPDFSGIT